MLTEQEMTSESLQLAPGAGLPFDAAVHNLEIASVWISPEEPSRRVASRRRKLAASPIVMSPDTVQKLMRKELEARSTPTPRRVGGAKKSDALKRLKMLRPVTPISSVSSSPSEGEMPSSSSLCDLPQNDEGASSSPMQRVGKLLSKVINEEKKVLTTIRGIDGEAVEIISWNTENPDAQPTKVKINLRDFMGGDFGSPGDRS